MFTQENKIEYISVYIYLDIHIYKENIYVRVCIHILIQHS